MERSFPLSIRSQATICWSSWCCLSLLRWSQHRMDEFRSLINRPWRRDSTNLWRSYWARSWRLSKERCSQESQLVSFSVCCCSGQPIFFSLSFLSISRSLASSIFTVSLSFGTRKARSQSALNDQFYRTLNFQVWDPDGWYWRHADVRWPIQSRLGKPSPFLLRSRPLNSASSWGHRRAGNQVWTRDSSANWTRREL